MLLDPAGPRFLDSRRGDLPTTSLWHPPSKVAAPHLWGYLAPDAPPMPASSEAIDVGDLLVGLAERHATLGENALAQRCLDAADQVRGALYAGRPVLMPTTSPPSGSTTSPKARATCASCSEARAPASPR